MGSAFFARPAVRGVMLMILACVAFSSMWVLIRLASAALHPLQIVFFRNALGLLVLVPMVLANPGLIRLGRWRLHAARGTSGFIATMGTFYSVANAPLTIALSINYTAPLFATLGAVIFLGERIRARRVIGLVMGFVGMLIVVRPGAVPLSPGVLAALISAVSTAFAVIAIRRLVGADDPRAVAIWSFMFNLVPSFLIALFFWATPPLMVWPMLIGIGGAAAIGQLAMSRAFTLGEASMLLPFDFVRFGLVTLAGITLFSERYDVFTLLGGGLILASTIYLAVREAQVARSVKAASVPPNAS
jgi:drug/metabolite transporter (DMT)-like permease